MILTCLLRMRQLSCYYWDISSAQRNVSRSGFSRGIISFLVVNFFFIKTRKCFQHPICDIFVYNKIITKRIKKAYASVRKIAKALQNDAIFAHKERLKIQINYSISAWNLLRYYILVTPLNTMMRLELPNERISRFIFARGCHFITRLSVPISISIDSIESRPNCQFVISSFFNFFFCQQS